MGLSIDAVTEAEAVRTIMAGIRARRGGTVLTPNLHHLRRLVADPRLGHLFDSAELVVADGMPLIWASRLQGTPLPERVAGSSLIWTLTEAATSSRRSIFLLGGAPGVAERAARVLRSRFPAALIAGTHCPPFGFEKDPTAIAQIESVLDATQPDIAFVCLGFPKQEALMMSLRDRHPETWFLGLGVSLSFVAGEIRRAPGWMQATGLEWLHRMVQEPRRLFRRYVIEGMPFAIRLFLSAARQRLRGETGR